MVKPIIIIDIEPNDGSPNNGTRSFRLHSFSLFVSFENTLNTNTKYCFLLVYQIFYRKIENRIDKNAFILNE